MYYRCKRYWRGKAAEVKLTSAAKISEADSRGWREETSSMADLSYRAMPHLTPVLDEDLPEAVH